MDVTKLQVREDSSTRGQTSIFSPSWHQRIAALGDKLPFLVLPGIRGLRPYNPARVMRQFGRTQIMPVQEDASSFVVDYDRNDKISFGKIIL